jgi:hypothetical protein
MLTINRKSAFIIAVAIVAMLVWLPPASAGQNGAGVWHYSARITIALINLTDYPLTYLRYGEPGAWPYPETHESDEPGPLLATDTKWQVDPYRTKIWYGNPGRYQSVAPTHYLGRITLYSTGLPDWKFDLVFQEQGPANALAGSGTWIGLSPAYKGSFTQVSAGETHTCGISETKNDAVFCWGTNDDGRSTPPAGSFDQVSNGYWHSCGVKTDGHIVCWGTNDDGRMNAPQDVLFDQVSATGWHTCGLKRDGYVVCWGSNSGGRATPPSGVRFSQISSAKWHNCGVKTDGLVVCWGDNGYGRMNAPTGVLFDQVSAGPYHTCGVTQDGKVLCWGRNDSGQATPPPDAAIAGTYQEVSAGGWHTCGLRTDGTLSCWGSDDDGRVSSTPKGTFTQVDAGERNTCANSEDGDVLCWGNNDDRQSYPVPLASMDVDGDWSTNFSNWAYGRWVTPWDTKMHNVMTLIGPKVMVTMYTAQYDHIVLVVQQLYGEDPTTKAQIWDDSDTYVGYPLDYVDNDGYSVPGQ